MGIWIKRQKETGGYSSRQYLSKSREIRFNDRTKLLEYLENNPNADGITVRDNVASDLPMSTFYDALARMGITYKKEPKYKGRNESDRKDSVEKIDKLNPSDLVFYYEMGVDNNICAFYGWSQVDERSYG